MVFQRFRDWLSRSISHRLVFYSTATATALALLLGAAAIPIIALQAVRNFDDEVSNSVSRITDRIELRIGSTFQNLQQLAKNSFVINAFVDSTGREIYLQPTLRDFVLPFGIESRVVLFDAGANPFAASKALSADELPGFALIAKESLASRAIQISVQGHLTTPTITFAIPIYYPPASDYEGVLIGIVPVEQLLALSDNHIAADECFSVESRQQPIYGGDCHLDSVSAPRRHVLIDEHPDALSAVFTKSRTSLYKQLGEIVLVYFLIAGMAIAATYAVSRRSSRQFTRQLQSLGAASRELVLNPQAHVSLTWPSPDEIGEFATSFSRMVNALQELHLGLEKRVAERTGELAIALQHAEAANTAKSQFLATMSHEIRTPLNGVLGMAQLLAMADTEEEERQEYVQTIISSGQALLTILNDILDFSKVEAGRLELVIRPFDPVSLIEQTEALFGESARSKGLTLSSEWRGPANVSYLADEGRLRQMLANLVGNAIKFTQRGAVHVSIAAPELPDLETAAETGVMLEFSVSDTGIGIPADKQELLFKPFSQVDASATRTYGGTGLGLSIVRSFAQLMGGQVGLSGEPGVGSTFWFTVRAQLVVRAPDAPVLPDRSTDAPTDSVIAPDHAGKILVVEDAATNRTVICGILSRLGYPVVTAINGQDALDLVRAETEELIAVLMDIQMPVLNGIDATKRIRQWEQESGRTPLPIIALTAGAFAEDRANCLAAGMADFLTKPINVDELVAALNRVLST